MVLPSNPQLREFVLGNMRNEMKRRYENPGFRNKMKTIHKKLWEDPNYRNKQNLALKLRFEKPEERQKNRDNTKNAYKTNPEYYKRICEVLRGYSTNIDILNKKRISLKKRYIDKQWYGSVKHSDDPDYCEKWTPELRERVREYFGRVCAECGSPENGKRLHVHHVWYNKKACCDNTPRSLVPLCHSCHSKTGHNRDYWSNHFQGIIDTYYNGKCWFTQKEMAAFKTA